MVFLTFLLVVQAIVAAVLTGIILMQQSEGGGLGMGGSPTGLMSARGAADFLTRATTILAAAFIGLSILHAVLAARTTAPAAIDTSLARKGAPTQPLAAPVSPTAPTGDPLAIPTPGAVPQSTLPQSTLPSSTSPSLANPPSPVQVDRVKPLTTPKNAVLPKPTPANGN